MPTGEKVVLHALVKFADEAGFCFPSQETIASVTGQDARTVRTHLTSLKKRGLIKREKRFRKDGRDAHKR